MGQKKNLLDKKENTKGNVSIHSISLFSWSSLLQSQPLAWWVMLIISPSPDVIKNDLSLHLNLCAPFPSSHSAHGWEHYPDGRILEHCIEVLETLAPQRRKDWEHSPRVSVWWLYEDKEIQISIQDRVNVLVTWPLPLLTFPSWGWTQSSWNSGTLNYVWMSPIA